MALTLDETKKIDEWIAKYPEGQQRSAVIPALHLLQKNNGGYLTAEIIEDVAQYLGLPTIAVQEVATFYSMFTFNKTGTHKIKVCGSVSCLLCGCQKIVDHLKQRLKINVGETTADGKFTLSTVECLGACVDAPMMQLDQKYYEKLTTEKIDEILESLA